ncbi:MAG TPA: FecR domain-containing protein [Thermoanaerobaculia bacterium]|nr:FecR domain-containing protein [Thermoanaerobaculia bacterium]
MSLFSKRHEENLDRAVDTVVNDTADPTQVEAATARVWQRLSRDGEAHRLETAPAPATPHLVPAGPLKGCADFQSLLPAYLAGELPPARALLVEDHTRSCIACRRALREARSGVPANTTAPNTRKAAFLSPRLRRGFTTALAAMLLFGVGLGLVYLFQQMPWSGAPQARVESIEGSLYAVAGQDIRPVVAGERFGAGVEVRTAKGSHAFVRLGDGSRVEMNERAGLSYVTRRSGTTIQLGQGRILVQAAKQHGTHLYVETADCRVSVTGTIFAVNRGTKGSRVSVVEGEVRVKEANRDSILHPGDQVATHVSMAAVPVRREIAWSKNAAQYDALLTQLTQLGKDIDASVARPGLRTSTRLLDLAPQETRIWVGLPNLSQNLAETQAKLEERLATDATLQQWWGQAFGSGPSSQHFHDVIAKIGDLGHNLGEEVAVAVTADGPVVLAEVTNPSAFRALLEQEVTADNTKAGKAVLILVDSPNAANIPNTPGADDHALYLWVKDDLFVATPSAALLARMGQVLAQPAANPFRQASFHARVAQSYQEGAGWLFAGDLKKLLADHPGSPDSHAEALGILDFQDVIVDRHEGTGRTETRAAVTFDRPRRGIPSWLAAPAPMRALDFVSPDANLAASFVVKDPVNLLDDLLAAVPELATELDKLQTEHGIHLRDLAASLGGEVALAVDGPLLPSPSWKLVLEVYHPQALESSLEQLVARVNDQLHAAGKPEITLTHETTGGRTYYSIRSTDPAHQHGVDYTFVDGYLVVAPSRALLDTAITQRAQGFTLASSAKFRALLPEDQQVNFSALVYHNLGSALAPLANLAPQGAPGNGGAGGASIARMIAGSGPTLTYAYAQDDRILFASHSETGPLGLNLGTLASLRGLLGAMGSGPGAEEAH